jgi:HK97 gp10 family phage protein
MAGKFVDISQVSKNELRRLIADLRKLSPETAKEVRKQFKKAAQPTLADARRRQPNATGELRRKTRIYVTRGSVSIRSRAPHGRISEFGARHPLWGRDQWVKQPAAPAIFPAVEARRTQFINDANNAVITAFKKVRR